MSSPHYQLIGEERHDTVASSAIGYILENFHDYEWSELKFEKKDGQNQADTKYNVYVIVTAGSDFPDARVPPLNHFFKGVSDGDLEERLKKEFKDIQYLPQEVRIIRFDDYHNMDGAIFVRR